MPEFEESYLIACLDAIRESAGDPPADELARLVRHESWRIKSLEAMKEHSPELSVERFRFCGHVWEIATIHFGISTDSGPEVQLGLILSPYDNRTADFQPIFEIEPDAGVR